ncbi:MAG: 3-deoxy-8-phosphooctulonate synthase [Planctomycetes bacterium]|nr:3-deoxy-8-phosphooctulonate synthase [Planctomycetota bacterium]
MTQPAPSSTGTGATQASASAAGPAPDARPAPREVAVGRVRMGRGRPLFFIGGPCVIESEEGCVRAARRLAELTGELGVPFVFKASFDKANRSSIAGFRGPGLVEGLRILARVRAEVGVPVLSDIHEPAQADPAAAVLDCLQIPAFLCRQTDLVVAAARTGKPVNIKKGEFMAPWDMRHLAEKAAASGNDQILLTERGTTFGYNTLVADMRSIPEMRRLGWPVVFDAGHSVQAPGGRGGSSGGNREMIPVLARAAVAAGCDGVFCECHEDPDRGLSDGPNMVALRELPALLATLLAIRRAVAADVEAWWTFNIDPGGARHGDD